MQILSKNTSSEYHVQMDFFITDRGLILFKFHVLMKGVVRGNKNIIDFSANLPNRLSIFKDLLTVFVLYSVLRRLGK